MESRTSYNSSLRLNRQKRLGERHTTFRVTQTSTHSRAFPGLCVSFSTKILYILFYLEHRLGCYCLFFSLYLTMKMTIDRGLMRKGPWSLLSQFLQPNLEILIYFIYFIYSIDSFVNSHMFSLSHHGNTYRQSFNEKRAAFWSKLFQIHLETFILSVLF